MTSGKNNTYYIHIVKLSSFLTRPTLSIAFLCFGIVLRYFVLVPYRFHVVSV